MNIRKIAFQELAIDRIYKNSIKLLKIDIENGKYKKIIFQSPTGSGKTVMASKIVEKIALDSGHNVSFIWISRGHLAEQSKKSFENYIGGGGLKFSSLEDILDNEIKKNEVLFTNWEKIFTKAKKDNPSKDIKKGDWSNKFMRDNEWDRNLKKFCENTRNTGRKIILIIDESHLCVTKNTIKIMADIINPALRIDITATPKRDENYEYGNRDGEYTTLDEVKTAKIIVKEVIINIDIKKQELEKSKKDGDAIVFEKAVKKRDELLKLYKNENSDVKPLVLIQLPNTAKKLSSIDKQKIDWVEKILEDEYGINYENKKFAKWLSGDKSENVKNIKDFDSPVEFLIFKQAIATGWDCPRAQILIKFRQTESETFEIQTVGRIMRSPEFKYYKDEILNRAYVYVNLNEIKIDEEAFNYIKTEIAKRKDNYKAINLYSIYLMRREYNDLKYEYRKYFFNEFFSKINGKGVIEKAKENFKKFQDYKDKNNNKINLDLNNLTDGIILDERIGDIDKRIHLKAQEGVKAKISNLEIEKAFFNFLKENTGEYQQARSFEKIKVAIYQTLENFLKVTTYIPVYNKKIQEINKKHFQIIVLNNKWFFVEIIEKSIKKYSDNREKNHKEIKENKEWNIPKEDFYSKDLIKAEDYKKSIMTPFYYSSKWKTETGFIDNYLEKNNNIEWWYKNGDAKNEIYFGILFEVGELQKTFYPDFIVKYKDKRIGIFDTKMEGTAKSIDTILKANQLSKYIKEANKNTKHLFGGIVIPKNDKYKEFKLNENLYCNYDYKDNIWEDLIF